MMQGIFLSSGHSDLRGGASTSEMNEAQICTELRDLLAGILRSRGALVLTDGHTGANLPLEQAISLAKSINGPRIEFHMNTGVPSARGVEAFSLPLARPLAAKLATITGQTLDIPIRGEFGWKPPSESQHSRLAFCTAAGGVILEVCFITNALDVDAILRGRGKLVEALADFLFPTPKIDEHYRFLDTTKK